MWSCAYDHLCINGVRFCGNWASGSVFQYILPAYKEFTLDFKTDQIVNARGFDIVVGAALYNNETVNITNGGVGKDRSSVYSQQMTLDNSTYMDKCGIEAREAGISYPGTPYDTTTYYQYTTNYPWYYDSTSYYQYTTNYPWYYDSTSYYQYSTGYPYFYESTTYDPYSTNNPWNEACTYYPYTTSNPYCNPYTPVASAFTSKDYVASLVQQVIQQLNSERYSQEQASLLLAQSLRYLRY